MTAPILIFAWGNPSRGDDALGPLFAERLEPLLADPNRYEFLTDFQLQVEHALDLQDRAGVIFVDADASLEEPFRFDPIEAEEDASFSTHALSPRAVLQVYQELNDTTPPPAWLLAIRGESFELGEPMSTAAMASLDAALAWLQAWLSELSPTGGAE